MAIGVVLVAVVAAAIFVFLRAGRTSGGPAPLHTPEAPAGAASPAAETRAEQEAPGADMGVAPSPEQMADTLRLEAAKLELQKSVPPHPMQLERITNISRETIPELVDHLWRYDDFMPADIGVGGGALSTFTDASYTNVLVTRLARVRRLLGEAQTDRSTVCGELRGALGEVNRGWEAARANTEKNRAAGNFELEENDPEQAAARTAAAAVYVLGELGDYESLGLMMESYSLFKQRGGDREREQVVEQYGPVAAGTLLYGIGKLIEAYPDAALDEPQRRLKDSFLEEASQLFAPSKVRVATRWDAEIDSFDPRVQVVGAAPGAQQAVLEGQPTEEVVTWPAYSRSGTPVSDFTGALSPEALHVFESAKSFADAVASSS